jgi:putative tryptophan/tyrosine transport system substrate-binding protein
MRRRDVLAGIGGSAVGWSLAARADEQVRKIGVLVNLTADDPQEKARLRAFRQELEGLGWSEGRNVSFDIRFAGGVEGREQALARELVHLRPDVILAHGYTTRAVQRSTRTIPVVFVFVAEPVAQGFVQSLARPGGNITGFTFLEPSVGSKWLELLTELSPSISRIAVVANPDTTSVPFLFFRSVEEAAPKFGVSLTIAPVHTPVEIEAVMTKFGREPGGGLILPADTFTTVHRKLIIELAAEHRLPLVTGNSAFPADGGLMYYGADALDLYRRAAPYVDRILRGQKPADLPVQAPTKFELAINVKTARALGLTVPPSLLAEADEVIE